jgi:hypothetical protein
LVEWAEYFALEPYGEFRADARHAVLCALLANIHRDPKKGRRSTPADWMLKFADPAPKRMSSEEMLRRVETINKMLGGKDLRDAR